MEDAIIEFLKENLSIQISQNTEFGPVETVEVSLILDGKEISSSSCDLPSRD